MAPSIDPDTYQATLRAFALDQLGAEHYPNDHHIYRDLPCPTCPDDPPRTVLIETHARSQPGRFRGIVTAHCERCDTTGTLLSFTALDPEPLSREPFVCPCGGRHFHLAACDRYESDDGLPGFYDEGVLVAHCHACGSKHLVVACD